MPKITKTAAAFLTFSFLMTGCAAKTNTSQNGAAGKPADDAGKDASVIDEPGTPASPADDATQPSAKDADAMLLERDVPLPKPIGKTETVVSVLLNGKQGVELYSHDESNTIYQYILQNDKWKKQELQFPAQLKESAGLDRLELLRGEDGRYYAFYALSDESYHLEASDDLNTFSDVTPAQWQEAPGSKGYVMPVKVRVSENGILCAIIKYEDMCRMYELKNGGKILDEFSISSYNSLEIHENQLLSESIGSKENQVYDLNQMKKTTKWKCRLTNQAAYEMVSPEEMYACNDNGIYALSNDNWQLIVDSSLNTFADPNYNWKNIRHVGERIYITFQSVQSLTDGKDKEGFSLKYFEYSTDIPKIDTTLTIWGLEENASIKSTLAEFRKDHPTVRVVYEIASDTSGVQTADDIIRQFNADLFAGNGPDLILLDGLHMDTYIERELLYDMGKALADTKPDLLPGVQALLEENSYAVPLRATLPLVIAPQEMLSDSLHDFLEKGSGKQPVEMTAENIFGVCYDFFDEGFALNKSGVTKDEITTFLELCKKASENWKLTSTPKTAFQYDAADNYRNSVMDLAWEEADFTFSYAFGLNQFCFMLDSIDQLSSRGVNYHTAGNGFLPQGILAVNAQSTNQKLAVKFVKKALSQKQQEADLSNGFPVHTKALDSWNSRNSQMTIGASSWDGKTWNTQWPSNEMIQRFLQSVKDADKPIFTDRYTKELVKTEAIRVISGETSAQDAAGRILNQLELYYEE
ncbi:MAG: extracellular solute-binding protein [Eubacterium sp.]|nr:extracellular solute-binding protein [Eubacterium sp.]